MIGAVTYIVEMPLFLAGSGRERLWRQYFTALVYWLHRTLGVHIDTFFILVPNSGKLVLILLRGA
jgi:hypothetical protein